MSSSFSGLPEPFEQDQEISASPIPEEIPASGVETTTESIEEGEAAAAPSSSASPEDLLPPETRGETNGGPLGCCLGIVVGLLLTALLTTGLSLALANGGTLSVATLPVLLIGTLLGGFIGWRVGKRIYKEYELSPRQKRKLAQQQRRLDEMERKRNQTWYRN